MFPFLALFAAILRYIAPMIRETDMVGNVLSQRLLKLWIPLALCRFSALPFAWMVIVSVKPDQLLLDTASTRSPSSARR
jgi:hypothetical protein